MPTYKPSMADIDAAVAAQSQAQRADDRARRFDKTAKAAEDAKDAIHTVYLDAFERAFNARATAIAARIDADRVIAIYTGGVSAAHPHYKAGGF